MLLNERYKLENCLFSNVLGELYRARDLQAAAGSTSPDSCILIHRLPSGLITHPDIANLKQELLHRCQQLTDTIDLLEVLEVDWSTPHAFIVMRAPQAWIYNPIPALDHQPTSLHLKASALTQALITQQLVKNGLDPAFFLVTPDGNLHLLGSALSRDLQHLQQDSAPLIPPNLTTQTREESSKLPLLWLALAGLATAAAAGGGYYQLHNVPITSLAPTQAAPSTIAPPSNVSILNSTGQYVVTTAAPSPLQLSMIQPDASDNSIRNMPNTHDSAKAPAITPPSISKTDSAPSLNNDTELQERLTRIQTRIDNQQLQSALYYLDLAQRHYPDNPEITALATQIVEHYYQQLEQQSTDARQATLRITANIIQEFNLAQLHAQQSHLTDEALQE